MKKFFLIMILPLLFILSGCNTQAAVEQDDVIGNLKISMLDVGHGDAILIQTSEQTILIDTGKPDARDHLVNRLKELSVTKIDKLILTHPHADHIGNARTSISPSKKALEENPYLEKISVAEVYDNGIPYASGAYRTYMKVVNDKGIAHKSLKVGDNLDFGDGVQFKVLFPTAEFVETVNSEQFDKEDKAYNINNGSIVGKLTYKDFSMMFTGDCQKESEAKILASNKAEDLKCDVLKAGHHGSATSSSKDFVATVHPSYVLVSSGNKGENGKATGHPHIKPLEAFLASVPDPKNIYCASWNGMVTVISDGKSFSVHPEINVDWIDDWLAGKKKIEEERRANKS